MAIPSLIRRALVEYGAAALSEEQLCALRIGDATVARLPPRSSRARRRHTKREIAEALARLHRQARRERSSSIGMCVMRRSWRCWGGERG